MKLIEIDYNKCLPSKIQNVTDKFFVTHSISLATLLEARNVRELHRLAHTMANLIGLRGIRWNQTQFDSNSRKTPIVGDRLYQRNRLFLHYDSSIRTS